MVGKHTEVAFKMLAINKERIQLGGGFAYLLVEELMQLGAFSSLSPMMAADKVRQFMCWIVFTVQRARMFHSIDLSGPVAFL